MGMEEGRVEGRKEYWALERCAGCGVVQVEGG